MTADLQPASSAERPVAASSAVAAWPADAERPDAPDAPDAPDVTVVVVTRNNADVIVDCLAALPAAFEGELSWRAVVVDNASVDDTALLAAKASPDVLLLATDANSGYAAGVNAGLAALTPRRAVLVINPDVRLDRGSVQALWAALRPFDTGICVPSLRDARGQVRHSLRREPTVLRALGEALLGSDRSGRMATLGEIIMDDRLYAAPQVADWASGAAMLISKECLDAVGPWDESFFLPSEEAEFILRARDHGFLLRYVPSAGAVQLGDERHATPQLWALGQMNRVRLQLHRRGLVAAHAMRWLLVLNAALRARRSPAHGRALRLLLSINPGVGFPPVASLIEASVVSSDPSMVDS
ncbi:glycosyltransferase [Frankia sp. Cj5]|uniref:glycosyltransferase n=1 Tax=Frankia sp. Cj5 TaxID=2880978 RepID=UPI001EF618A0|nr:glycosyltransferase family 2 protein [Frankia sp. Cj5]